MKKTPHDLNPLVARTPRLLVVGGTGRLGGLLRRAWRQAGAGAGVMPLFAARREGAGGDLLLDPLACPEALAAALRGADAVLDLAGPTSGPPQALAAHAAVVHALLAARPGRMPLIVASSAAVYGRSDLPIVAEAPLDPASAYGRAKQAMEAELAGQAGCCCLRIGNVAGADALLGVLAPADGRRLHVFADGAGPRRSYIGPQALAIAMARLVRLMVAGLPVPPVLNLALPGALAMEDLLRAAGQPWAPVPAPEGVFPRVELDVTPALRLGLVPAEPALAGQVLADLRSLQEAPR